MRNQGRYLLELPAGAPLAAGGEAVALPERESRHLLVVRRAAPGDRLELCDGRGRAWEAELTAEQGGVAWCRVVREMPAGQIGSLRLVIAAAVPKGKRMSWLVEKCAELGVDELWPAAWSRSPRTGSDSAVERWERVAEAAAKQSRRAGVMAVSNAMTPADIAAQLPRFDRVLVLELKGAMPPRRALEGLTPGASVLALIGPEGGLTPKDIAPVEGAAAAGLLRRVSMGPNVLRVETAAVALAAAVLAEGLSLGS